MPLNENAFIAILSQRVRSSRYEGPSMKLATGTIIRADAFLFDMDGTLVDSTDAIERVWTR